MNKAITKIHQTQDQILVIMIEPLNDHIGKDSWAYANSNVFYKTDGSKREGKFPYDLLTFNLLLC